MHLDRPNSARTGSLSPPGGQTAAALADLLAGCVELGECCEAGLKFVLEAAGRSSGLLFVCSPGDEQPVLVVQQRLSASWAVQMDDPSSPLRRLAIDFLIRGPSGTGGPLPGEEPRPDALAAALPLAAQAGVQGALLIQGEPLPPEQAGLLADLAPVLGRSMRIFRSIGEQQARALQAASLQADLAELAFKADLDGFQRRLVQGAGRVLESDAAILILVDEENPGWLTYKALDCDANWALHLQPDEGKGPVSECLRTGQIICLEGAQAQVNFDPTCTGESLLQARSLLCAPLRTGERTLGALLALNKPGGYRAADRQMIASLTGLAASEMQAGRLIQQYRVSHASLEASRLELLASHNFLSALFDHLPANLYIIDREYTLLAVNENRLLQAGKPGASVVGQPCFQALFGRSEPCLECQVSQTLAAGHVTQRSERRRTARDEISDWEISAYPILDDQGGPSQAILLEMDATEKRRLEATLTQSEKLAAVGQLAAGVAHEINNPLTAIIANAQILRRELPPESDLQESVDLISRAGARAAQVVRNLLDFARKDDYRLRYTDVNETLELALELVRHELVARSVIVDMDLDASLPPILASADHLQGVWLNLLLNAIDSLDKPPYKIGIASREMGSELYVTISDNGKGIPAENLGRIFEPFYTTKAPGRGTGLGLSVSHRIVKQHGGRFQVDSRVGEGSAFTVILPLS